MNSNALKNAADWHNRAFNQDAQMTPRAVTRPASDYNQRTIEDAKQRLGGFTEDNDPFIHLHDRMDLDPQNLCEGFEALHRRRLHQFKALPEKEIGDYVWRVMFPDDYEDACAIREQIVEVLSDEYCDSVSHDIEQRENRKRVLEKNGLI